MGLQMEGAVRRQEGAAQVAGPTVWVPAAVRTLPSFDRSETRVGGSLPCSGGRSKHCHQSGRSRPSVGGCMEEVAESGGAATGHGSVYGWDGIPGRYLFFCLMVHTVGLSWLTQQP